MDTRLISGNEELYEDLLVRFEKDCIAKSQDAFLETRRTDLRSRYKKSSYTVFLQEPNVKESCGGLRDYQNILWVARVKTGSDNLRKLVDDRLITNNTFKEIQEAYDFLMRVRNELHYHSRKRPRTSSPSSSRESSPPLSNTRSAAYSAERRPSCGTTTATPATSTATRIP